MMTVTRLAQRYPVNQVESDLHQIRSELQADVDAIHSIVESNDEAKRTPSRKRYFMMGTNTSKDE